MPRPTQAQPSQTFSPVFHRWSANLNWKHHLTNITLANVLAGDTCDPISLSDFEGYLAYKEHTLENLQFVIWFQDYRSRFSTLSEDGKVSRSGPRDRLHLTAPSRASVEQRAAESLASPISPDTRIPSTSGTTERNAARRPNDVTPEPALSAPESDPTSPTSPTSHSGLSPLIPLRREGPLHDDIHFSNIPGVEDQPFRRECMRVVATFLRPNSAKELSLDAIIRDTAIRELAHNTHPDVFLPIYREVYHTLESVSLHRFLVHNSANINLPKQIFWYGVGLTDLLIGIVITISLVTTVTTPPQPNRAWRLFAVPFISFGAMQTYSAWRGFCTQVWQRGNVQLRVWEMQDVDEDFKTFWDRLLVEEDEPSGGRWDSGGTGFRPKFSSKSSLPFLSPTRNGFIRPPIFGPEKVVLDPTIKAVHQKVVNEILSLGLCAAVGYAGFALGLPSLHR